MSDQVQDLLYLQNLRIVFPKLLAGQEEVFKGKDGADKDPYYSASWLIDPTDPQVELVKAEIRRVAQKKYPQNWEEMLKVFQAKDKLPIHDGLLKANKPYGAAFKGMLYISARDNAAKKPPRAVYDNIVDPKTGHARVITSPTDPKFPYSGAFTNVYLSFFTYNQGGGEGIGASIAGVQFHADGERLAGGVTAQASAFKAAPPPAAVAQKAVATGQGAASLF
jgi:hypothetical protein